MTYNVAAEHLCDLDGNFLEEGVDTLARQNKLPEDMFDLITEFAEELRDILLDNDDVACVALLGDILDLAKHGNKTHAHLIKRRDDFIATTQQCHSDITTDHGEEDDDDEEAAETAAQVAMATHILDDLSSRLTPGEIDTLINIAVEVDAIRKSEPLHVYYAHRSIRPY